MIRSSFQQKRRDHVSYLGYLILTLIVLLSFTLILHTFLQANAIGIDFFVYWNSGKALFIENQNPYNDSITLLNQMGIRGRPSLPDEDQFAFVYPLYGLLAVLLTSFLSYDWAISFWLAFNILALCITLYLIFPKSAKLVSLSAFLFYPIFFGLVVGNFSSLVDASILLILGLIILREFRQPAIQVIAAALFAWATIKPQHIWLYLLFILAIAVRLKLWLFIKAFFAWLAGYFTFAFLALPDWPWHMSNNMKIYAQVLGNFVIHELLTSFVPGQIAGLLSALILISCLGMVLFQLHQWWQGKLHWIYAAAWVGLTTFLAHPHGTGQEQFTFLIPLILWMSMALREQTRIPYLFWFGAMVISWLPVLSGNSAAYVDRSPVLFNAIWVLWLTFTSLRKEGQISPMQSPKTGLSA